MKNLIYKIFAAGTLLVMGASCEDDAALTTLSSVKFAAPIEASPSTMVISSDNNYQNVTTISWSEVAYPVDAPATYALQFDVATDTIGATAWSNAIRVTAGEAVLSRSFLGSELNKIAKDLGLPIDQPGEVFVRVESTLDRTVYSDPIMLTITPFTQAVPTGQIYMPGTYNNFGFDPVASLQAIDSGVYQGYMTFAAGELEFKFTTDLNMSQVYGADASGNFTEGGTGNFSVSAPGSYQITVNLNTMSFAAVPYSWGIIGTATSGQWDHSTEMTYDYQQKLWRFVGPLMSGALKYRLNDNWSVNYGQNTNTDPFVYLDNQGAYTISVPGTYEVTFSVNADPATANYTVTLL